MALQTARHTHTHTENILCVCVCGFKSDGLPVWRSSGGAKAVFRRRRRFVVVSYGLDACLHWSLIVWHTLQWQHHIR